MVEVAMGIKQQHWLQGIVCDEFLEFFFLLLKITARIDNAAVLFFVIQDVGILFNGIKNECLDG